METGKDKGVEEYLIDEDDEDEYAEEDHGKKRSTPSTPSARKGSAGGGSSQSCQVEDCTFDMSDAKQYHRRHRVCEHHAKAAVVVIAGLQQRFCQQCSKFHNLSEFDEAKRSCRKRLAQHNERRRKSLYEIPGEGSS